MSGKWIATKTTAATEAAKKRRQQQQYVGSQLKWNWRRRSEKIMRQRNWRDRVQFDRIHKQIPVGTQRVFTCLHLCLSLCFALLMSDLTNFPMDDRARFWHVFLLRSCFKRRFRVVVAASFSPLVWSIQFKVKDSNVILIIIAKHFISKWTLVFDEHVSRFVSSGSHY